MNTPNTASKRIQAIDILRGITIAGMILVNNPGSWSHIFAPLEHAPWNGMTPTDLVFPFFMFVMGMCIYLSLLKFDFGCTRTTVYKILRRTVLIYLVGLAIGWFARFCFRWADPLENASLVQQIWYTVWSFDKMRLTGVLARLAVCYGATALIAVTVNHRRIPYLIAGLLVVYTIVLFAGNGFAYNETNILAIVDRAVLTDAHMYHDNGIDPEGLLSTLPALAHTMLGLSVGRLLFGKRDEPQPTDPATAIIAGKVVPLFVFGTLLAFGGWLLSYGCPINKKIWSPTYVLMTCGLASVLLALLMYAVDVRGRGRWFRPFEVFGANPLFLFVVSDVLSILFCSIRFTVMGHTDTLLGLSYCHVLSPVFGPTGGSLAYALLFVLLNWCIGYQLYKRRIYIKL